ncbi:uncharacterized protein (TIGR02246 family) [Silvibacterium bohemicum]|uniref:Uncharacterized protein (TIGR02246 family) n=1 Tax=Silvibacterium bohemicum TaxID=1577686 RepID=A0A841JX84_9BACT|nr:DUF4440 domain-containing protein [Silvibacterium bohemicum]MBB6146023.1 uncharacterized protein (TIGR02246 family) [Silvibacterium bohemicum]
MRQNRISGLLSVFLCLALSTLARPLALAQINEKAAIEQVLRGQQEAWNKGDIQTFMRGYKDSPDTTFIGKSIAHGYQPILKRYLTGYSTPDAMGHLDFSELDTRMLGPDHAVVVGKFHLTRNAAGGGDASGIYSLILEREPEGWRIILDHTSTN